MYGRGNVSIYPNLEEKSREQQTNHTGNQSHALYQANSGPQLSKNESLEHGNFSAKIDHKKNVTWSGNPLWKRSTQLGIT